MNDLELRGSCIVFHAYVDGKKVESWDYFHNYFGDIPINVVDEDTLDLTKYEEVHIRQASDGNTYYDLNEGVEVPDDYQFKVKVHHVILPNKEVWDMYELVDENIDYETWQSFDGEYSVDYLRVTEEGIEDIKDEDIIEMDDEW